MLTLLEKIQTIFQWIQRQDTRIIFGVTLAVLLVLRAAGFASFATFLALVYIMYFVSAGRR